MFGPPFTLTRRANPGLEIRLIATYQKMCCLVARFDEQAGGRSHTLDDLVNETVDSGMHFAVAASNDNEGFVPTLPLAGSSAVVLLLQVVRGLTSQLRQAHLAQVSIFFPCQRAGFSYIIPWARMRVGSKQDRPHHNLWYFPTLAMLQSWTSTMLPPLSWRPLALSLVCRKPNPTQGAPSRIGHFGALAVFPSKVPN